MFDAFLFLTIISVASCTIVSASIVLTGSDDADRRNAAISYARASLDALLMSTLQDAHYLNDDTPVAMGNDTTVEDFLLKETILISHGNPVEAFEDYNDRIEEMTRKLLTGAYRFTLRTRLFLDNGHRDLIVIGEPPPQSHYSAYSNYELPEYSLRIGLVIWFS